MTTPVWIPDILAGLMLAVAAVSAVRLAVGPPWRRGLAGADIDLAHLLMAIAMAGMLAPGLATLPDTAWAAVFALVTAWFAWQVRRDVRVNGVRALASGHCAPHLAHSGAMLYMFLAATSPARGSGMGAMGGQAMTTLEHPTLAFVCTVILAGYSAWDLDRLSGRRYGLAGIGMPLAAAAVPALPGAGTALAFVSPGVSPGPGDSAVTDVRAATAAADSAPQGGTSDGVSASRALLLSPGMTVGCRVVMGVSMAFMLAVMI
jgi:uncharacterized protein DUF5134